MHPVGGCPAGRLSGLRNGGAEQHDHRESAEKRFHDVTFFVTQRQCYDNATPPFRVPEKPVDAR
jgi:hypothetical protein